MSKRCDSRVFDSYFLRIEAGGKTKKARRKRLNRRLRRACEEILAGRFPDQRRTEFCENQGGNGGP